MREDDVGQTHFFGDGCDSPHGTVPVEGPLTDEDGDELCRGSDADGQAAVTELRLATRITNTGLWGLSVGVLFLMAGVAGFGSFLTVWAVVVIAVGAWCEHRATSSEGKATAAPYERIRS